MKCTLSLDLPGPSALSQEAEALKDGSVTLLCNVEDKGNPIANEYIWTRGEDSLSYTSYNLTLDNIAADSQGNISCAAVNILGQGQEDILQLLVCGKHSIGWQYLA